MANLFAAATQPGPKPLVTFRAGKMFKEGNLVKPDKRKGQISLVHADDMLIHFQWKDRYTGTIEEDLVIFPDEAVFSRVDKCTTGRVYMLDFKGTNRQLFYWLQEPKEDKDEENCTKMNSNINNPPPFRGGDSAAGAGGAGDAATAGAGGAGGAANANNAAGLLGQLDRNQLMGLLAGLTGNQAGGAAPGAGGATSATQPGGQGVELAALQQILSGLAAPGGAGGASGTPQQQTQSAAGGGGGGGMPSDPSLLHVLDPAPVTTAVNADSAEFVSRLQEHLPPLPEGTSPEAHLRENLRSSQLQQTVGLFQSALSDPQAYQEIVGSFGLQPAPASRAPFGTTAFLDAIAHAAPPAAAPEAKKEEEAKKEDPKPEGDGGDKMEE